MKTAKKGKIKKQLEAEIEKIPSALAREILDFVYFLKGRRKHPNNPFGMLSESALKKDWLRPKEDKAWRNL